MSCNFASIVATIIVVVLAALLPSHRLSYIVLSVVAGLIAYKLTVVFLTKLAWKSAVSRMQSAGNDCTTLKSCTPGWTFLSRAPSNCGSEALLHRFVHYPCYLWKFMTLSYYIPRNLFRKFVLQQTIRDEDVWDILTKTMLIMFCETNETGEIVTFRGDESSRILFVNGKHRRETVIDGSTLVVRMKKGRIESATTADGPVTAYKWLSRNEIIFDILVRTQTSHLHIQLHVAAERNAANVATRQVAGLAPAALFTHTLHNGLLHHRISPGSDTPFIRSALPQVQDWVQNVQHRMESSYWKTMVFRLHNIKAPSAFHTLQFYLKAYSVVTMVLKKHDLLGIIDVDDFFAATVLHNNEHALLYQILDKLPAWASYVDSHWSSFMSMLENTVFNQAWNRPTSNPLYSEFVKDSNLPFFQELHCELVKIDKQLADMTELSVQK